MGVGHAAVALATAKVTPGVNVGWLVFAAFLADFLLGIFAMMGFERAHVPTDFASRHYLTFTFCSRGLTNRSPGKREKSRSVVQSIAPCSIARAAR